MKSYTLITTATALAIGLSTNMASATTVIPVANPTFVNAANFDFRMSVGDLPITAADVGQWVSRQADEDQAMDIADIQSAAFSGGNTYMQDGSTSMLFQSTGMRGLAQIIDVTAIDMSKGQLELSAIFSSRTAGHSGIMRMAGYNDLTGLTVDLGGDWSFTGGTQAFDYGTTAVPNSEIEGTSIVKTLDNTSTVDFDYLVIILGGDASADNSDADWVAIDDVQLVLTPEPSALLLATFGVVGLCVGRRRRRRQ